MLGKLFLAMVVTAAANVCEARFEFSNVTANGFTVSARGEPSGKMCGRTQSTACNALVHDCAVVNASTVWTAAMGGTVDLRKGTLNAPDR